MFCFYPIQQTSNHDTYNVPFLSNSTDFQSWHLQWSVTKQFKSSNHDTYNVLFLSNSTDFQSWHLQCFVSIQFNRLPSTGHQNNTLNPKQISVLVLHPIFHCSLRIATAILTGMGTAQTTPPILQFIWIAIFVATDISCFALFSVRETTIWEGTVKQIRQIML